MADVDAYVNANAPDDTGDGLTLGTAKQLISSALGVRDGNGILYYAPGVYDKEVHGTISNGAQNTALQKHTAIIVDSGVGTYLSQGTSFVKCDGLTFKGFSNALFDYSSVTSRTTLTNCRFTGFKPGSTISKRLTSGSEVNSMKFMYNTVDNCNFQGKAIDLMRSRELQDNTIEFRNNLIYNNDFGAVYFTQFLAFDEDLNGMFNNIWLNNVGALGWFASFTDTNYETQMGGVDHNCYFGNTFAGGIFDNSDDPKLDLADIQGDTGTDMNSIDTDPQLVDAPQGMFEASLGGNADGIGSDGLAIGPAGRGHALTNNINPTDWANIVASGTGSVGLVGDNYEYTGGASTFERIEFPIQDLGGIEIIVRPTWSVEENHPSEIIDTLLGNGIAELEWRYGDTEGEVTAASWITAGIEEDANVSARHYQFAVTMRNDGP